MCVYAIEVRLSNCVAWKIRRASRILTRVYDEALTPYCLTSAQLGTLDSLADLGQATLTQLAEAGGYERSATWRGLQPLIHRSLVQLVPTTERASLYAISPEGAALLKAALKAWRTTQNRVSALLGDDLDRLMALVEKLDRAA